MIANQTKSVQFIDMMVRRFHMNNDGKFFTTGNITGIENAICNFNVNIEYNWNHQEIDINPHCYV
jgi:hypothetical protein